ncbi:Ig-like domain-containing protein [Halorhabdus tiamatea]|nr:Ig-like domain-containing protein [Halorhabdus tiamatea]
MDHSVEVQQQLQDLRNAIVSMPGRTSGTGTTISLGTSYPARIIALNPAPPSGRLSTDGTADPRVNLTITNATAVGETGDVWNGSTRSYNTGGIVYEPNYNRYRDPPTTIYENSLLYNSFDNADLTLAGQSLLSGNRISLVTLNGSLSRSSSASTTVDTRPITSSDRTVLVAGNATSPITLNLTTRLSASRWTTLLEDEASVDTVTPAPNADAVPGPFTRVQVTLDPGQYRLQMAKVGVGTGATQESASYLTDVSLSDETITWGENATVVLEVRDAYNNPQSGITVNGSANQGSIHPSLMTSDSDGRVAFTYNSTGANGSTDLNFSLDATGSGFDASTPENGSVTVEVTSPLQSGGGGGGPFDLEWTDPGTADYTYEFNLTESPNANERTFTVQTLLENELANIRDLEVDFVVDDPDVDISPSDTFTDEGGEATVDFSADRNKTVKLWAIGGGGSDLVNVTIINTTSEGFAGDTTPPSIMNWTGVGAYDRGDTNQNSADVAEFDVGVSDDASLDRLELTVTDGGNTIGQDTVNLSGSSDQINAYEISLNPAPNLSGNNQIEVTITAVDASGNSMTCTGIIDTINSNITKGDGDFQCS